MRLKKLLICYVLFTLLFFSLLTFVVLISGEDSGNNFESTIGENLSPEVLAHRSLVEKYAKKYDIEDYINYLLAIMEVESGGRGEDVMQSSESMGLPPNSLPLEQSIEQGCKYFASLLKRAKSNKCDIDTVIQAYNYGSGFIDYVSGHGRKYNFELAENFSKDKSGGIKIKYSNPLAIKKNGGWRYRYGNMFYVPLVKQYLTVSHFNNSTVQQIMNEALKYEGWPYVFGGSSPGTSFDCSGLTSWCFGKAGIRLPRTAQGQYDATQHIPLNEAKPGDLVFFHGTYNTSNYISHVGIYVGGMKMFHAGDPIGYTNLTYNYWKQHIVCAGRIKK